MAQRYTVFSNDRKLIVTDENMNEVSNRNVQVINYKKKEILTEAVSAFLKSATLNTLVIVAVNQYSQVVSDFNSLFKQVKAAGGIVRNEKGEILFIRRFGRWDLPKGKMNKGETSAECAAREVQEETGLRHLDIKAELARSYHLYTLPNGKTALKETFWFGMQTTGNEPLMPQTEENITECRWFGRNEINIPVADTYDSLRHVIAAGTGA